MHHGDFNVSGVRLTLDILDTSGAYEFPAMRTLSMQSADAFILVYDITDANSFTEVRTLRDQIHETKDSTAVPIVVVGNKVDLAETGARQVSDSLLRQRDQSQYLEMRFHCTSHDIVRRRLSQIIDSRP